MRYLKEAKQLSKRKQSQIFENELKEFCEDNLVYLSDEGVTFRIVEPLNTIDKIQFHIIIKPPTSTSKRLGLNPNSYQLEDWFLNESPRFKWGDIKDHFIPFFTRLDRKYTLVSRATKNYKEYHLSLDLIPHPSDNYAGFRTKEQVFNDDIDDNLVFSRIILVVSYRYT